MPGDAAVSTYRAPVGAKHAFFSCWEAPDDNFCDFPMRRKASLRTSVPTCEAFPSKRVSEMPISLSNLAELNAEISAAPHTSPWQGERRTSNKVDIICRKAQHGPGRPPGSIGV